MCFVSFVGDFYRDQWQPMPWYPPGVLPSMTGGSAPYQMPSTNVAVNLIGVTREEFDDLKRQVLEMKELLKRAKAYDEANGEPDCEIDEKMELLRKVAAAVGVDLDDVLKSKAK